MLAWMNGIPYTKSSSDILKVLCFHMYAPLRTYVHARMSTLVLVYDFPALFARS